MRKLTVPFLLFLFFTFVISSCKDDTSRSDDDSGGEKTDTTEIAEESEIIKEAYAVLSENRTTLTFYYDDERETNKGEFSFSLNEDDDLPEWQRYDSLDVKTITNVVFDSSFSEARPTSTYAWFDGMTGVSYFKFDNLDRKSVV